MDTPLESILESIEDPSQPIPISELTVLSDLDPDELTRFSRSWDRLDPSRKQELLREIGEIAETEIEFTFEAIDRLALTDGDSEVRRIGIKNLWESNDLSIVDSLIASMDEGESAELRTEAARALGRFVLKGEMEAIDPDLQTRIEECLLRGFTDGQPPTVRRCSLEALGFSSRPEVSELIKQAYKSSDDGMKRSAVFAMGRSASKVWKPSILKELDSPSPEMRSTAAWSVGELEIKEGINPLIELLDDVNDQVRETAIWSLGQLGGKAAADAIQALLDDPEEVLHKDILEDAFDHIAFLDSSQDFLLMDADEPEEPTA